MKEKYTSSDFILLKNLSLGFIIPLKGIPCRFGPAIEDMSF